MDPKEAVGKVGKEPDEVSVFKDGQRISMVATTRNVLLSAENAVVLARVLVKASGQPFKVEDQVKKDIDRSIVVRLREEMVNMAISKTSGAEEKRQKALAIAILSKVSDDEIAEAHRSAATSQVEDVMDSIECEYKRRWKMVLVREAKS